MKTREVTLASGIKFTVPQGIQRIDTQSTHGWQVRYQGTKFFSDGPSDNGAAAALDKATKELLTRIATMPAPVVLKRGPSAHKTSKLPAGISGPIVKAGKDGKSSTAVLSVLLPRFGTTPLIKSIYIGSESTYTQRRYREALAKAVAMREDVLRTYEAAATRAKRKEGTAMRVALRQARAAA